jgi:hypothetical protein
MPMLRSLRQGGLDSSNALDSRVGGVDDEVTGATCFQAWRIGGRDERLDLLRTGRVLQVLKEQRVERSEARTVSELDSNAKTIIECVCKSKAVA